MFGASYRTQLMLIFFNTPTQFSVDPVSSPTNDDSWNILIIFQRGLIIGLYILFYTHLPTGIYSVSQPSLHAQPADPTSSVKRQTKAFLTPTGMMTPPLYLHWIYPYPALVALLSLYHLHICFPLQGQMHSLEARIMSCLVWAQVLSTELTFILLLSGLSGWIREISRLSDKWPGELFLECLEIS